MRDRSRMSRGTNWASEFSCSAETKTRQNKPTTNSRLDVFDGRSPLPVDEVVVALDDGFGLPRFFKRRLHLDADKLTDWRQKN